MIRLTPVGDVIPAIPAHNAEFRIRLNPSPALRPVTVTVTTGAANIQTYLHPQDAARLAVDLLAAAQLADGDQHARDDGAAFVDGTGITPGTEGCCCTNACEMPCWQRLGIAPACGVCGCPPFPGDNNRSARGAGEP